MGKQAQRGDMTWARSESEEWAWARFWTLGCLNDCKSVCTHLAPFLNKWVLDSLGLWKWQCLWGQKENPSILRPRERQGMNLEGSLWAKGFACFLALKCPFSSLKCPFSTKIHWAPTMCFLLFSCSVVSNSFATPWAVALQARLSMGFSRQEH